MSNNRAQEIRQRRLIRREEEVKEREIDATIKANNLYEQILNMLEKPTKHNTADSISLSIGFFGKIKIGNHGYFLMKEDFDEEIILKVAEKFRNEEGYEVIYERSFGFLRMSKLTITIK